MNKKKNINPDDILAVLEIFLREKQARLKQTSKSSTPTTNIEDKNSYTSELLTKFMCGEQEHLLKKVGEEASELIISVLKKINLTNQPADITRLKTNTINEAADLLFHILVVLVAAEISLQSVLDELAKRHQKTNTC